MVYYLYLRYLLPAAVTFDAQSHCLPGAIVTYIPSPRCRPHHHLCPRAAMQQLYPHAVSSMGPLFLLVVDVPVCTTCDDGEVDVTLLPRERVLVLASALEIDKKDPVVSRTNWLNNHP